MEAKSKRAIPSKEVKEYLNDVWDNCKEEIINDNFSIDLKNLLKDKIHKLPKNEMCYIFKIIVSNGESYNKNKNGIFFDLNKLSKSTLEEINKYLKVVSSIENNRGVEYIMKD